MSEDLQNAVAVPKPPRSTFGLFLIGNLLFGTVFVPCVLLVTALVCLSNDDALNVTMATLATLHLSVLVTGLVLYRKGRYFRTPAIVATLFVFLSTRHDEGQPDDSPFSKGIGSLDHQRWGITGYFRTYDNTEGPFGAYYFDLGAVLVGVEMSIVLTIVLGILVLWGVAIGNLINKALRIDDEPVPSTEVSSSA